MPLSTRVPTAEFRSLLLPPIRIPLRALQSLHRPQWLPCGACGSGPQPRFAQRRHLVLYKTARAETVLGQHKVLPFERYEAPSPNTSEHLVNVKTLPGEDGESITVTDIKLQDLYDNYVKDGHLLYLVDQIPKRVAENVSTLQNDQIYMSNRTYGIVKAETIKGNKKAPHAGKGQGALRVTPLSLSSTPDYFKLALDRSYQFIKHGSPVEFSIRIKGGFSKSDNKLTFAGSESWSWLHNHFPHLRPDLILKTMPEGSMFVVDPVSDGRIVQFVIARPTKGFPFPKNLTNRLFQVRKSVETSIVKGQQAQLPKRLRSELHSSGHEAYSPLTGMPINKVREANEYEKKWESRDDVFGDTTSPSSDRYIPGREDPAYRSVGRNDKLDKVGQLKQPSQVKAKRAVEPKMKGSVRYGRGMERGNVRKAEWARGRGEETQAGHYNLKLFAGSTSET